MKETKDGTPLVKLTRGHLVIPTTKKEYELFGSYNLCLSKKDFEKVEGEWGAVFQNLGEDKVSKHDLNSILFYIPSVIYKKLKEEEPKLFNKIDFIKLCSIFVLKDYPKKRENELSIHLDLLKEYKQKVKKK